MVFVCLCIQISVKFDRSNQVFAPKSGLLLEKMATAALIKSAVVFASIRFVAFSFLCIEKCVFDFDFSENPCFRVDIFRIRL